MADPSLSFFFLSIFSMLRRSHRRRRRISNFQGNYPPTEASPHQISFMSKSFLFPLTTISQFSRMSTSFPNYGSNWEDMTWLLL